MADQSSLSDNVVGHIPRIDLTTHSRIIEALLFAASEPLSQQELAVCLPKTADIVAVLESLKTTYEARGVNLVQVADKWTLRTAQDLSFLLHREAVEQKKLSKAALETLAIIAYHQPVTRAEIEEIRGVAIYKGTLDILMQVDWIKLRGRRRVPGRPVTYGTTEAFLNHFGLNNAADLPGLTELKAAGLLESNLPSDFIVPQPASDDLLGPDEEELDDEFQPALEMDLPEDTEVMDEPEELESDAALEMDRPEFLDHK